MKIIIRSHFPGYTLTLMFSRNLGENEKGLFQGRYLSHACTMFPETKSICKRFREIEFARSMISLFM